MAKAKKTKTAKKATTAKSTAKTTTKAAAKATTAKKATAKTTTAKKTSAKTTTAKKTSAKTPAGAASNIPLVGKPAPAIDLLVGEGETLKLASFKGDKAVVLYFYPKDDTPGCTKQACTFQKDLAKYKAAGAVVIGVSPDSLARHAKFKDKYGLAFQLAADEDNTAARKYGAYGEKSLYGRKFMGIIRSTFLIDKQGRVAAAWPKVKVDGHSDEVLAALQGLG
jgi:peroxiredoxin Q/BCP